MRFGEAVAGLIAQCLGWQAVTTPIVGGRAVHRPPGRQQDGLGDAHRALVGQQHIVHRPGVAEVLGWISMIGSRPPTTSRSCILGPSAGKCQAELEG